MLGIESGVESVEGLALRVRPIAEEDGEDVAAEETMEEEGAQ